jgi:teichoic acid transport system permease protein
VTTTDAGAVVPDDLRPEAMIPPDPAVTWPSLQKVGERVSLRQYVADIWARREFALEVPLGQLRAQNQNTVLGQVWNLANPLLLTAVYWLIFVQIIGGRAGLTGPEYLAFLLVGVITFESTRTTMRAGARMIARNRRLVQSINFPRAILPLAALIQEGISYAYALPVMWIVIIATGFRPSWSWLLVVPIVLLQGMFNLGLCMVTARLSFHFRDVQQVLPYMLRIWFYSSGALFPIDDRFQDFEVVATVLRLNPAFLFIDISRDAFLYDTFDARTWALAGAWAVGMFVVGFWYFRRAESEYGRV